VVGESPALAFAAGAVSVAARDAFEGGERAGPSPDEGRAAADTAPAADASAGDSPATGPDPESP